MLKSELKSQIDKLRGRFWSGGISNPLTAIEQISYLIFMKRLEDMDNQRHKTAQRTQSGHTPVKFNSIFKGNDRCKWAKWIQMSAEEMLTHVRDKVFPFIKNLKGEESLFGNAMKDAVFMIPKPSLLQEAVKIIDEINISEQNLDTQGDLYEYLLSKLNTSGENGQFRTPRHIIRLIVKLVDPKIGERICDPAAGTGGFLVNSYLHILEENSYPDSIEYDEEGVPHNIPAEKLDKKKRKFLKEKSLFGYDFDTTMVRIGQMNLLLHGIDHPQLLYADTLSKGYEEKGNFDAILANPPFKGSIDKSDISDQLKIKSTKTELLFINLFIRLLVTGGRCGVIVPDGVLFGSSKAHQAVRKMLVDENQLEGIISMPSGVFKPYAGVSTAVLIFTKGGTTDKVWFYDMQADGYSLDDKRQKIQSNDIPDIVHSWQNRHCDEEDSVIARSEATKQSDAKRHPERSEGSKKPNHFWVTAQEIRENKYDLSISRYKEIEYKEVKHERPESIANHLLDLEETIIKDINELKTSLK